MAQDEPRDSERSIGDDDFIDKEFLDDEDDETFEDEDEDATDEESEAE